MKTNSIVSNMPVKEPPHTTTELLTSYAAVKISDSTESLQVSSVKQNTASSRPGFMNILKDAVTKGRDAVVTFWNDNGFTGNFSFFRRIEDPDSLHDYAYKRNAIITLLNLDYVNTTAAPAAFQEDNPTIPPVKGEIYIGKLNIDMHKNMDAQTGNDKQEKSDGELDPDPKEALPDSHWEPLDSFSIKQSYLLYSYNNTGDHSLVGNMVSPRGYSGNLTNGYFKSKA